MSHLDGRRILVVEDNYVIATDIVDMIRTAGATTVGPAGWAHDALALASDPATLIDLAILDVDLHGTPSYAVANALMARGVPIIFTTGYGGEAVDPSYVAYPRLEKPVSERALMAAIAKLRWAR